MLEATLKKIDNKLSRLASLKDSTLARKQVLFQEVEVVVSWEVQVQGLPVVRHPSILIARSTGVSHTIRHSL